MALSVKHHTLKYLQWLLPSAQGTCQNTTYNGHLNLFPSPLIASIPLLFLPSMYPMPFFSLEDNPVRLIGTAQPLNQSIWGSAGDLAFNKTLTAAAY